MSIIEPNGAKDYQPQNISLPALYTWPLQPLAIARYLLLDMIFPWGLIFLALAYLVWEFLTPGINTMATLEPGWIALLWLRNCGLLLIFAGGLHWCLYRRRCQFRTFKFHPQWQATNNKKFLHGNQVHDNMFWSIASGVTTWTLYEAITYWIYASGLQTMPSYSWYLVVSIHMVILWSTTNFYFVHRLLHWQPVYRRVHELHHRNVNVGPWSGISMHPVEHLLYFSPFILWWFIPVHPLVVVMTGFYQALSPALSHSGFEYLSIGGKYRVKLGDWFHHLHHQYFNVNFGNTPMPFDWLFGSWHDGSATSLDIHKQKMRTKRLG